MSLALVLTLLLSVLIGLSLGLLGGGGSILTVPILTYVAGLEPKEAITTSLVVVGVTSIVSAATHARKGRVKWRTGLVFGAAGMAGAFGGGLLGGHIPGTILMIAFALMMVATSAAMIRGRRERPGADAAGELPVAKALLAGGAVGLVTGLVGAGGGFLDRPGTGPAGRIADGRRSRHIAAGHSDEFSGRFRRTRDVPGAGLAPRRRGRRRRDPRLPARGPPRRAPPRGGPAQGLRRLRPGHGRLRPRPGTPLPVNLAVGIAALVLAAATTLCVYAVPRCPLRRAASPEGLEKAEAR